MLGLLLLVPTLAFLLVAISPRLFEQGDAWLTLEPFASALQGPTLQGLLDSLVVAIITAFLAVTLGCALAWLINRTSFRGGAFWGMAVWGLMLMPSYLSVVGWESLMEPQGVLSQFGLDPTGVHAVFFGPVGIVWVLTTKGLPFAFLACSAGMLGLGQQFEDAARVHGAGPAAALRVVVPILAPALWSAAAIVFAESISDFGVASTLAAAAHFPVATYTLYRAIGSIPIRFPVASAVGWFLVATVGVALLVQYRALNGRSYAVLSGRTRPAAKRPLGWRGQALAQAAVVVVFIAALGVPLLGAVSASLFTDFSGGFNLNHLTLATYQRVIATPKLFQPVLLSARMAALSASFAIIVGLLLARVLAKQKARGSARLVDLLLLAAVALPSIVLAAGYIFAYNLPLLAQVHIQLYGTLTLLAMAYTAACLPATARMLVGPVAQIQGSLVEAARVHGAGEATAWRTTVLPLLSRGLLWAWLLTLAHIVFELPISQLLYPPGQSPLPVAVVRQLESYDFAGGSAMIILTALAMLAMIGLVLAGFRWLVPGGWQLQGSR
ncbi:MAG: iron ABC transporter permease [Chloroflexi bacterium]|nr:iron ABC transporter permease [Chloroflexota bacterium]